MSNMNDVNDWNQAIIAEFRANGGKVGGPFEGASMVLLHTTGAKSGKERVNPLVYDKDGDRVVLIASKGGAPTNPDWYYNLIANPDTTVEIGTETFGVHAEVAQEPERTRIFEQVSARMPGFAEYQRNTTRVIPIVLLTRAD